MAIENGPNFIFDVSCYELFYDSLIKSSSRQDNAFDLRGFIC